MNHKAEEEELNSFLSRVDDVSELIQSLRSSDAEEVRRASERARLLTDGGLADGAVDERLHCVVGAENKRCVNPRPPADPRTAQQEEFKWQMEKDVAERTERKKKARVQSDVWKMKGIQAFRDEQYADALEYYSKAISILKDSPLLYTSRAQTLLKLQRPADALKDLDLALRLDEGSLRALVHTGKAHQQLKQWWAAGESFNRAMELHPEQRSVIQVYVRQVQREQDKELLTKDETKQNSSQPKQDIW